MVHALTLLRTGWGRFRNRRRGRPVWGGFLLVAAGIELLVAPAAQTLILPIDLIVYAGVAGVSGTLIALLMITLGVLSWLQPAQHVFFGLVGLFLSLASFVTSNFGGFVIGMLLGIVGGSLVFAWTPRARGGLGGRRGTGDAPTPQNGGEGEEEGAPDTKGSDGDATDGTEKRTETHADRAGSDADSDERLSIPRDGTRPLAALALPLAAIMTLASAPAPTLGWPWDWFRPPSDEEEQPAEEPSPSPAPTEGPGPRPTDPGGDEEGREGDEEAEPEEEPEEDQEEGDADQCELRTGESALAASEEEFLDAVRACEAAQEEGSLPDVLVAEEYDCFPGSVRTSGLSADRLTMSGARYDGIVECPTRDGARRYIRLSMSRADFSGAELWFEDAGTRMSLGLPTMVMDGDVQMHVTRMHVRILGIPLTFTPDFPPPLLLPYMIVTDVDVDDPVASTGVMNIPSLNGRYGGS